MGKLALPEAVKPDAETAIVEGWVTSQHVPTFKEVVSLVRCSPTLRIAFDADWQIGVGRASKVGWVRQEVMRCHGEGLHGPIEASATAESELQGFIDESEIDPDYWDGIADAVSFLLTNRTPLLQPVIDWTSAAIVGLWTRPKETSGPHPLKHSPRDIMVTYFLNQMDKLGVPITENEATKMGESACHAISVGLAGHYTVPSAKTLMNIWSRRSQNWRLNNGNE
jgi:hypothetical protein